MEADNIWVDDFDHMEKLKRKIWLRQDSRNWMHESGRIQVRTFSIMANPPTYLLFVKMPQKYIRAGRSHWKQHGHPLPLGECKALGITLSQLMKEE